jgi:Bifunctional DNA primase/polymerase, N-terminal
MDACALLRLQLLENGWTPLASSPIDKACYISGWPTLQVTEFHIENWSFTHPASSNTALLGDRGYFGLDIDIASDPALAQSVVGLAIQTLGVTPFIRIGRPPRSLLVYRCLPKTIVSASFRSAFGNGDAIEVLAGARNFTAFGRHPSGRNYCWVAGTSPLESEPNEAPLVDQAAVDRFFDRAHEVMPFARSADDRGTGRPKAGDPNRMIGADGRVVDGREALLRDCIFRAANQIAAGGQVLTAKAVAGSGWELFADQASLTDGRWNFDDALAKARSLARRLSTGAIKLEGPATVTPTYVNASIKSASDARTTLSVIFNEFITAMEGWFGRKPNPPSLEKLIDPAPPVHAVQVSTGVGKTRIAAEVLAADRITRRSAGETGPAVMRPLFYLVPTHRLGDDIAEQFIDHGLSARVFRGREAAEPGNPGSFMCRNLEQVRVALEAGANVATSCCRHKARGGAERRCAHYLTCAYQAQLRGEDPDVWAAAHEMLFHAQKALGEPAGVVVDEGFWSSGLRISQHGVGLGEMMSLIPRRGLEYAAADLDALRTRLAKVLQAHPLDGVKRSALTGFTTDDCHRAIGLEWMLATKLRIFPGMPSHEIERAAKAAPAARRARRMISIWAAIRELIEHPEIETSGHLVLEENENGERYVFRHGVAPIRKQWRAPTLLLDATLPDMQILRAFYPNVVRVAQIEATMPHVTIRQVLKAPISARRLIRSPGDGNRIAVRRYILQRWLEVGRGPTLVICQEKYEAWLKDRLPAGIMVEHFNNIAGLDDYKNVRLIILIGRTIPGPQAVEVMAGALTASEPIRAAISSGGGTWYDPVVRGIRLPDGSGVAVDCDQHPDPVAEAVRWQICEAELIQALGRARGVNRNADTPLDADLIFDVCLPITVDTVTRWSEPSALVEMAVDGVMLASPVDMVRLYPKVWSNEKAADRTLKTLNVGTKFSKDLSEGTRGQRPLYIYYRELCPCVRTVIYQPVGPKKNRRAAYFNPELVPDARAWLESRLGPLAYFEEREDS